MTECKKFDVGYHGQRYEVQFSDGDGVRVFGWTDNPTGGVMVNAINAHPTWNNPVVIDLRPEEGTASPKERHGKKES